MTPELHDVVVLLEDTPDWPAGTRGTVVDLLGDTSLLVELVGPDGSTLDLIEIDGAAVEVAARHPVLAGRS